MGRIVVTEFVSIDGVFEDPGGAENYEHGGWTFEYEGGDDFSKFKFDELMEHDAQLLERTIELPDAADLAAATQSPAQNGYPAEIDEGAGGTVVITRDPWSTGIRIRSSRARP